MAFTCCRARPQTRSRPDIADSQWVQSKLGHSQMVSDPEKQQSNELFIKQTKLHAEEPSHQSNQKEILLSQQASFKPTLVLDLDETLIHSRFDFTNLAETILKLPITMQTAYLQQNFDIDYIPLFLCVRPGARECLKLLADHYEVVIWTASTEDYTKPIIQYLNIDKYVYKVLYKQHCSQDANELFKDLDLLGRDVQQTIIVDNVPQNFRKHKLNGIHIQDFEGRPDELLSSLTDYLITWARQGINLIELKKEWKE